MSAVAVMGPPVSPKRKGRSCSSRQSHIRQGPKKGGHGGWGKVGEEGVHYELFIGDPNFDDADEYIDGVPADFVPSKRVRKNSSITFEVSTPRIAPHEMEDLCKELIRQYFHNEDINDFILSIEKLKLTSDDIGELVTYAVDLSMDYESRERELASLLISQLTADVLSHEATRKGFNELLMGIDETVVDCPHAEEFLSKFLARAVADDCLAPCFLKQHDGLSKLAVQVVVKAQKLMSGPHGMARLDRVWGSTGGSVPLSVLKKRIIMFIKEYVSSRDVKEAMRCLIELGVPSYHHEAIYQILYHGLQNPECGDAIFDLLEGLHVTNVCSSAQIDEGFERIFNDAIDINLDVPFVFQNLDHYVTEAYNRGYISEQTHARRPRKARKRYVSEGDGGRYAENRQQQ